MKDIKQYLHLYLGSEVFGTYYDNSGSKGILTGVTNGGHECEIQFILEDGINVEEDPVWNDANEIKLILRPLSDMTEEEMRQLFKLMGEYNNAFHVPVTKIFFGTPVHGYQPNIIEVRYEGRVGAGYSSGSTQMYLNRLNAESHHWLLSKSFDLFGLIEAGLAIDKTTTSSPSKEQQ